MRSRLALAGIQFVFFRRAEPGQAEKIFRERLPQYLHSDSADIQQMRCDESAVRKSDTDPDERRKERCMK